MGDLKEGFTEKPGANNVLIQTKSVLQKSFFLLRLSMIIA